MVDSVQAQKPIQRSAQHGSVTVIACGRSRRSRLGPQLPGPRYSFGPPDRIRHIDCGLATPPRGSASRATASTVQPVDTVHGLVEQPDALLPSVQKLDAVALVAERVE